MASFAPIKGTRSDIGTTPIVEGQFLVETDQSANNRIYLDKGTGTGQRIIVGGNANYIDILADQNASGVIAGNATTAAGYDLTFTNAIIDANCTIVDLYCEQYTSAAGTTPTTGDSAHLMTPLGYTGYYIDDTNHKVGVHMASIPDGTFYKFKLRVGTSS